MLHKCSALKCSKLLRDISLLYTLFLFSLTFDILLSLLSYLFLYALLLLTFLWLTVFYTTLPILCKRFECLDRSFELLFCFRVTH